MPTLNGITYEELEGSGGLTFGPNGIRGVRTFIVDWEDRVAFAQALLGYTNAVGHVPIRREAETLPGYEYLYCQHAEVTGLGEVSQGCDMIAYPKARVAAEYAPLRMGPSTGGQEDYEEETDQPGLHLEETWDFAGETLTAPGSAFTWSDTGESLSEPVGVMVATVELTLTSESEPELPAAAIRSCLGKVNSGAWYGAEAERVLFLGASARRVITSSGSRAWRLCYRFRERQMSWNARLRGADWVELSPKPYAAADFSVLIP